MRTSPFYIIVGPTNWDPQLYERGEYAFMVLPEYSIIFP